MSAVIGQAIVYNADGVVIINLPCNALPDLVLAEPEFKPIIDALRRPYVMVWIDRPQDEEIDRIGNYRRAGGGAHCVVAELASDAGRRTDRRPSVQLPNGVHAPVTIPRLPNNVADAFYKDRINLRDAFNQASVVSISVFSHRLKAFAAELASAL